MHHFKKLFLTVILIAGCFIAWGYLTFQEIFLSCEGNLTVNEIGLATKTEKVMPQKVSLIIVRNNFPLGGYTTLTNEYGYFTSRKGSTPPLMITDSEINAMKNFGDTFILTSLNLITKNYMSSSVTRSFSKDGQNTEHLLEKIFNGNCYESKPL